MKKGLAVFKKGKRWIPGGSSKLSFWHDNWTMSGPLRLAIQGPLLEEEENLLVKDINGPGRWDWSKLSFLLPDAILMELKSIPHTTLVSSMEDRLIWSGTSHGDFDLKSAYYLAMNFQDPPTLSSGQWVWKMETLPHIKFFIWMCLHDSIGVGVCLARRGLRDLETYQICQREPETILHGLRDCVVAKKIWAQLGIKANDGFFEEDVLQWFSINCKDSLCRARSHTPWRIIFAFAIWMIWK